MKTLDEETRADEWKEFEKVCRPVVEFLQKYHCTPHHRVIIDWSSAVLIQDLKGIPFKFRIENWR
ncbi:MAG: hypothetical protein IKP64_00980 [Selenomonadaceae bacterium]|nr:hypothetical protein [Selenomonadaceae bacterium]MBR4382111.1 hypothetical protein [Selenomonadaceae bacterium]